jgi:CheY-like chemotaxis protein
MIIFDTSNVRILVVDDYKDYLSLIIEKLTEEGYQGIDTANNETEAKQKLAQNYYDVIITDIRLEGNPSGGFEILEIVKQHKITSIVIIITSNESVKDCRRALQGSVCWDYISKTMEDRSAFSELHDSIQKALVYLNHWGNRQDKQWIQENWDYLLKNYPNQHIAVLNHSVLAAANSQTALEQQLVEKRLPSFLPVFKYIEVSTITDIIQQGEGETIEFKRIYQYNSEKQNKKDEKLRFAGLKTIAAFLNTNGGILLIGVEDDGGISGIKQDIEIASKRHDKDGFVQTITNAINDNIGAIFTEKYILVQFETVDDKEICVIKVTKSKEPAFLTKNGKSLFFIRNSHTTRELDTREVIGRFFTSTNDGTKELDTQEVKESWDKNPEQFLFNNSSSIELPF